MITEVLKESLPKAYGINRPEIILSSLEFSNPFPLSDSSPCQNCKTKYPGKADCDEVALKINNNGRTITVINHELYINQFGSGTQIGIGKRCDYLLADENHKIAFCDLTCSLQKWVEPNNGRYPEGKRAEVRQKLKESVTRFTQKDKPRKYIEQYQHKDMIFGWRDPSVSLGAVSAERGNPESNMRVFGTTAIGMAKQFISEEKIDNIPFRFIQVKYPTTYNW